MVKKIKLFLGQNFFKIRVGGRLFFNQLISEKFLQNHNANTQCQSMESKSMSR